MTDTDKGNNPQPVVGECSGGGGSGPDDTMTLVRVDDLDVQAAMRGSNSEASPSFDDELAPEDTDAQSTEDDVIDGIVPRRWPLAAFVLALVGLVVGLVAWMLNPRWGSRQEGVYQVKVVSVPPKARIYVGKPPGKFQGFAPHTLTASQGEYTITLKHKGYQPLVQKVKVTSDQTFTFKLVKVGAKAASSPDAGPPKPSIADLVGPDGGFSPAKTGSGPPQGNRPPDAGVVPDRSRSVDQAAPKRSVPDQRIPDSLKPDKRSPDQLIRAKRIPIRRRIIPKRPGQY